MGGRLRICDRGAAVWGVIQVSGRGDPRGDSGFVGRDQANGTTVKKRGRKMVKESGARAGEINAKVLTAGGGGVVKPKASSTDGLALSGGQGGLGGRKDQNVLVRRRGEGLCAISVFSDCCHSDRNEGILGGSEIYLLNRKLDGISTDSADRRRRAGARE